MSPNTPLSPGLTILESLARSPVVRFGRYVEEVEERTFAVYGGEPFTAFLAKHGLPIQKLRPVLAANAIGNPFLQLEAGTEIALPVASATASFLSHPEA